MQNLDGDNQMFGATSHRRFFQSCLLPVKQNHLPGKLGARRMRGDLHGQQQNLSSFFADGGYNHGTFFAFSWLILVLK